MSLESELYGFLVSNPVISAVVADRVYPLLMPQNTQLPAITYQRISGASEQSMTGASGLAHPRIQLDCWGSTYKDVTVLREVLRQVLQGFRGQLGTIFINGVIYVNDQDFYEWETKTFRTSTDVKIWHNEDNTSNTQGE